MVLRMGMPWALGHSSTVTTLSLRPRRTLLTTPSAASLPVTSWPSMVSRLK